MQTQTEVPHSVQVLGETCMVTEYYQNFWQTDILKLSKQKTILTL